jgi:hypothetical protein
MLRAGGTHARAAVEAGRHAARSTTGVAKSSCGRGLRSTWACRARPARAGAGLVAHARGAHALRPATGAAAIGGIARRWPWAGARLHRVEAATWVWLRATHVVTIGPPRPVTIRGAEVVTIEVVHPVLVKAVGVISIEAVHSITVRTAVVVTVGSVHVIMIEIEAVHSITAGTAVVIAVARADVIVIELATRIIV